MTFKISDLNGLDEFCTLRQLEFLEAVRETGGMRKAAAKLGVAYNAVFQGIQAARQKMALRSATAHQDVTKVPAGFAIKGTSTLGRTPSGDLQWVKTTADEQQRARMVEQAFEAMTKALPRLGPLPAPADASPHLCNLVTMTDCHVGMLAERADGGADWNIAIAEHTLGGAFDNLVGRMPRAKTLVLAQLGDWLHQDGILPVTPTHGHVLDASARFQTIIDASIRILRRMVDRGLQTHERVVAIMGEGNHDITSSMWLQALFAALYEAEPRVTVVRSRLPFYVHQHGQVMLGFHHGHMRKPEALPGVFAAQFPQVWGATVKRYVHCGHRHHVEEKEHPGVKVVQHPTMAARDAYAARGGWISERQISGITYHAQHGEAGRVVVTPEMLG